MGNTSTRHSDRDRPPLERSLKLNAIPARLPMPEHAELERRFTKVLASMDLPPDKARLLKSYDDDKKWELVCDQERFTAKEPPEYYLDKLRVFLDPAGNKKSKSFKSVSQTTSSQTLRDLEISLRTNHIEWVRLFLSEEHKGLDILVDYLFATQFIMSVLQNEYSSNSHLAESNGGRSASLRHQATVALERQGGSLKPHQSLRLQKRLSMYSTARQSHSKITFGDATDDVHLCIMCLRAIMNHQYGFNLVFAHKQAINCIALSLRHKSYRTKTLVLELLAAVCLVSGGHQMILSAFDNFKLVCGETHRFETLMSYFRSTEDFHIDFMVACMQFINIVVHSVEQVNFRVHLQHEFSLLGLDQCLEKLRYTESDRLPVQVNAYLDNTIDVQSLLEDSDTKTAALDRVAELQEALSYANERLTECEENALAKIVESQKQLAEVQAERDMYKQLCEQKDAELAGRPFNPNITGDYVEALPRTGQRSSVGGSDSSSLAPPPPAPPLAPPPPPAFGNAPPPPAPPLSSFGGAPPAPPPPGFGVPNVNALPIKKHVQPKYRLPVLNWVAMKPNQVKGTLFSELDDEKLYNVIDFYSFEEMFKLGSLTLADVDVDAGKMVTMRRPETTTLLEPNRMRNVAITRRKIENTDDEIARAINGLDLKTLFLERVEILLRIVPNEQEVKAYKEYEKDRKPLALLSDEDKFMISLTKVERLGQKLHIMSFIGNFFDTYHHLQPQLNAVIAASISIRNSSKIRRIIEIILAFGNYMNSSKRGAVYGFKLQSLDMLCDTKSNDKKMTLLHYIVRTVRDKFPEVAHFDNELKYIEKAATVSLDNIISDIAELEKGMEMTRKEYEARKDRDPPIILRDFLANSEDKIKKLRADAKSAQEAYSGVVEFFGENAKTMVPTSFFPLFVRFVKAYKQAEIDFENWKKLEEAQNTIRMSLKETKKNPKQTQEAVVGELKQKQRQIKEKKVLNRDEVYHGALEDILLDLKNEPYRRADGVRRSQRRHGDNLIKAGASQFV